MMNNKLYRTNNEGTEFATVDGRIKIELGGLAKNKWFLIYGSHMEMYKTLEEAMEAANRLH